MAIFLKKSCYILFQHLVAFQLQNVHLDVIPVVKSQKFDVELIGNGLPFERKRLAAAEERVRREEHLMTPVRHRPRLPVVDVRSGNQKHRHKDVHNSESKSSSKIEQTGVLKFCLDTEWSLQRQFYLGSAKAAG